jgi:hypothetical protein
MVLVSTGRVLLRKVDTISVRCQMSINTHYLLSLLLQDVGASEMVADGRIKIKSDSELERFTDRGVLFKDGSELEADVIVLATG